MSNFEFLALEWPELAENGRFAEQYVYSDPKSSLNKSRMIDEAIVNYIYEHSKLPSSITILKQRIIKIGNTKAVPDNIIDLLEEIRKAGNPGAHANSAAFELKATEELAKKTVFSAYLLCDWFNQKYGSKGAVASPYNKLRKSGEESNQSSFTTCTEKAIPLAQTTKENQIKDIDELTRQQPETTSKILSLSDEQKEAAYCEDRFIDVVAGPGSGKTAVLTERIRWLIEEKHVPSERILVLSYSSKAANEVRKRLKVTLGANAYNTNVYTFHSLGMRIIRNNYEKMDLPQDFEVIPDSSLSKILGEIAKHIRFQKGQSEVIKAEIGLYKAGVKVENREDWVLNAFNLYTQSLQEEGYIDYNDMINLPYKLLSTDQEVRDDIRGCFSHILVDEAQDLSERQIQFLKKLIGKDTSLFVVGDDDQCIYQWRGANPDFLKSLTSNPSFHTVRLSGNFRSEEEIVKQSAAFIEHNTVRIAKNPKAKRSSQRKGQMYNAIEVKRLEDARSEAEHIASTIDSLVKNGNYKHEDIAILLRNTSQAFKIEEALSSHAIPYEQEKNEQASYYDALRVLRAVANITKERSMLEFAINFPDPLKYYVMPGTIYRSLMENYNIPLTTTKYEALKYFVGEDIQYPSTMSESNILRFKGRMALFEELHSDCFLLPVTSIITRLIDYYENEEYSEDTQKHTQERAEKMRQMANILSIAEEYERSIPEQGKRTSSINDFLDYVYIWTQDGSGKERHKGAVNLMTCHKSKGLEFGVVFIPGVQVGTFPNDYFIRDKQGIESERRLLYVSMTRATDKIYITCNGDPLAGNMTIEHGFLAEMPELSLTSTNDDQNKC